MNSPKIYAVMNEEYAIKSNRESLMGTSLMGTVPMSLNRGSLMGTVPMSFQSLKGTVPMILWGQSL